MNSTKPLSATILAAAVCTAAVAGPKSSTGTVDPDQNQNHNITPEFDWDKSLVSEETIALNKLLYENREQIALMAEWDGISPQDVATIRANGGNWRDLAMEHLRLAGIVHERPRSAADSGIRKGKARSDAALRRSAMSVSVGDAGGDRGGDAGVDAGGDNRSLARANLWPGGVIPYTFSDDMVEAFFFTPDPNEDEVNAASGVSNALAVMILLEQDTTLQFVPFDPVGFNASPVTGYLLWESNGDGENDFIPDIIDDCQNGLSTDNFVTRIGRNPDFANPDATPTTINHGFWSSFPSMIRSMGFVLGLDWQQRHPDRDTKLDVSFQNIPPDTQPGGGIAWPRPIPFPPSTCGGNVEATPGFPAVFEVFDAGANLFLIQQDDPTIFPVEVSCDYNGDGVIDGQDIPIDLTSMMLVDEFGYNNPLPMYTIDNAFRYRDLDGDGVITLTPDGDDDLLSAPQPVYFSDCDLATLAVLYEISGELCPADLDGNGIVNQNDITIYLELYNSDDPAADLNLDGEVTVADLVQFFVDLQQSTGCDRDTGIGGSNTLQPIG